MTEKRVVNLFYFLHMKTRIKFLLVYSLLLLQLAGVEAINYRFGKIDTNDGLSDNQINCITKDSEGFIWFGNMNGLNRYDGYKVKVYQYIKSDTCSINNNFVISIQEAYDHKLWIHTFSGLVIYNPNTDKFIRNVYNEVKKWGMNEEVVTHYIDSRKNVWLANDYHFYKYDTHAKKLFQYSINPKKIAKYGSINSVIDKGDKFWFVYYNGLIEERDYQTTKLLKSYNELALQNAYNQMIINRLFVDNSGDLWVYSLGRGVLHYERKTNKWESYNKTELVNRLTSDNVNQIAQDKEGLIWVGTDQGGINIIDKTNKQIKYISSNPETKNGLSFNSVQSLYCDECGIMWVGTYKQGVNYYHPNIYKFEWEKANPKNPYALPFNDVNAFLEDKMGNLWFGSNGSGLAMKDKNTGKYTLYVHNPRNKNSLPSNVIVSLKCDSRGRIWIGTYMGGLSCFDGRTFVNYSRNPKDKNSISNNSIWDIVFEPNGNLWIGTLGGGVEGFDNNMNKIAHLYPADNGLKSQFILSLTMDYPNLIIGTAGGMNTYNLQKKQFVELFDIQKGEKELVTAHINLVFKDSRGLYWIGTLEGLNCYDPKNKELLHFTNKDGLSDNVIQSIVEDENSDMWISTVKGICRLKLHNINNVYKPEIVTYNYKDGLQNSTLNFKAALRTSKNKIYFGGTEGVNYFELKNLKNKINEGNIVFTNFQIYNHSIQSGTEYNGRVILPNSISKTNKITLLHKENFFSIEFAALNYFMPQVTHYLYKLDGFNSQWIKTNENTQLATFTNLSPGKYTLLVKAVYKGGQMSTKTGQIIIEVLPPWWLSSGAISIYVLIFFALAYYTYRIIIVRLERNHQQMEAEKEHKLDEMKLQFFTNISHEFRTPLTLILTPLEKIISQTADSQVKSQLEMMRRNAKQLLTLVNQVLDFRKLEITGQEIVYSKGDIIEYVKSLFLAFSDAFERKQISASFSSPVASLWVNFDSDKIQKVITNLLSNALKFTNEKGEIKLAIWLDIQKESKKAIFRLDVIDSGIGISEVHIEKVFDTFYQVSQSTQSLQGSGIGLHLVKKYVELMGGTIQLVSELGVGSTFSIIIPLELIESLHITTEPKTKFITQKADEVKLPKVSSSLSTLLIVEDNDDLRTILNDSLSELYQVIEAPNGKIGLEMALANVPDLIITDLMMPLMDGLEMSKTLREDLRTSHIPILLLTAKVSDEVKMSSLKIGIEDYITKPFNMDSLMLKVRNIRARQKSSQKKISVKMEIDTKEIHITSMDEKLINKAVQIVEENMSNADLSVEEMSKILGMSRVNMYKKMLAITGKSPIEFIRIVRLKRAAQLLEKSQLSIAEIAYEVGFNTPRYFSKYFKEEYGMNPTVYVEKLKKNNANKAIDEPDSLN
jgi:signal transduction histidine kinase/ligand-binding sensor domain-containing protein/DNA-binding response OmpR family regulator